MKSSKKVVIIVALVMIAVGLGISVCAMVALGFDFRKMNTVDLVTNTYELDEEISAISVKGVECDVRIIPSEDGNCKVVCHESDKVSNSVNVENGVLSINYNDNRKWYERIGVFWGSMKIDIYLPEGEYDKFYVKTVSGDINIPEGYVFAKAEIKSISGEVRYLSQVGGDLSVKTTSGDIFIGESEAINMSAVSTSGKITMKNVTVQSNVNIKTVSGDVELSGIECENISADTTSGEQEYQDVVMDGNMNIKSISGDVDMHRCDAGSIRIKTTSGDVSGTLLTDKIFTTDTVSGDVDVPRSESGGECEIITTSGDIEVDVK